MKSFLLYIHTPFSRYYSGYVQEIIVATDEYVLGILPDHAPLVAKVKISKLVIVTANNRDTYAVGEGLLNVKKDEVVLLVESIESKREIDIDRAKLAKDKAINKLKDSYNIDKEKVQKALARANNRISVYENE
ncbi:MAG: ATP synthase F1 subunit epsilon [Erysipelotrichia bacterium]|nr:ATP synthase F1 subunit epsilon [Erysipelotrichia bacterium]